MSGQRLPIANAEEAACFSSDESAPLGYFGEVVRARFARRSLLRAAGGVGLIAVPTLLRASEARAVPDPGSFITFAPIQPSGADAIVVPKDYVSDVVIRWGDPLLNGAPPFDLDRQTPTAQGGQFGFNCDFVAEYPLPRWIERNVTRSTRLTRSTAWLLGWTFRQLLRAGGTSSLLWVNHEYTSGTEMFIGYSALNPTRDQVNIEIAAHGASIVKVFADRLGKRVYDASSAFNRRITGETPMVLTGPAAGHPLLRTSADPSGRHVKGMFNNCGGGVTPWGTVLSCEENFDQYFANFAALAAKNPQKGDLYARLPPSPAATERKWERFHQRFDVAIEPNEYARFGYVVEIDPYDPSSTPRKHTALGRFKHEAAVSVVTRSGKVAVYTGDDARFEYAYKFLTAERFNAFDRSANLRLLESGTLYVAKFNEDGTGQWLPLVHGTGPLTAKSGFSSQAEVLLKTRAAADAVGATKMDRPEDIEVSPTTNKVYIALTNNAARTTPSADAGENRANPRLNNSWGHVVEITEAGGDNGALTFRWEIFLLCGDPATTPNVYFAGFDPKLVSPISCPDNLDFDEHGNLWIATDAAPTSPGFAKRNDGIFAVPTEGSQRGYLRQFMSGVRGCEIASLRHSGDGRTLYASIQHPGEGRGLPSPVSTWPDGTNRPPRPSVVAVRHARNQKIGR